MKQRLIALGALLCLAFCAHGQDRASDLPWQQGPTKGVIGDKATIDVPEGYAFLDAEQTHKLNRIFQNPDDGGEEYTLAPKDLSWIAFFSFDPVGYVKDDEKLDPSTILSSIKDGTEQANEERRKEGWDPMRVVGWSFEPRYDKASNHLEWAIVGENEKSKQQTVNYNTRLLGRHGVMQVVVVANPEALAASVADVKRLLAGYTFDSGETYAEYRAGDHVAEYGLAALITGGAAAVAAKKGLFGAIGAFLAAGWKMLVAGFLGLSAWLKSLFGRKSKGQA